MYVCVCMYVYVCMYVIYTCNASRTQSLLHSDDPDYSPDPVNDLLFLSERGENLTTEYGLTFTAIDSLTLSFTGMAPQANYQDILSEIFFQNTAEEPCNRVSVPCQVFRNVSFLIIDGTFNDTATTMVTIESTPDPAFFDFGNNTVSRVIVYNEVTREPVHLFQPGDDIIDPDNTANTLEWLTVEVRPLTGIVDSSMRVARAIVTSPPVENMDMLSIDTGDTGLQASFTIDEETGSILLNISGVANFSTYLEVLQTLTYVNTFPGLENITRVIEVVTFDGTAESQPQQISVEIQPFNDPPMCYFGSLVRQSSAFSLPLID